jgi:hypothetical protein
MKRLGILLVVGIAAFSVNAQQTNTEEKKTITVEPYGFIRNDVITDSRKMFETREGVLILYPKKEVLDPEGNDINEVNQFKMLSLSTRMGIKSVGPDAFGAKTSGQIEMDFYGVKDDVARMIRVRHAFLKLNWGKPKLLFGQYWHMIIVPECSPSVINFGGAAPYHPLNRMPQVRLDLDFTDNLSWSLAAGTYGYHNTTGADAEAQRNSGIPDIHTQLKFKNDMILTGFTGGIKVLQPRLKTDNDMQTKEKLFAYDLQAFLKVSADKLTIKSAGVYGQNLSMYTMLGGYVRDNDILEDDYSYLNLDSYSIWADVDVKAASFINAGLFFGYSGMLGAKKDALWLSNASNIPYARGYDIDHIMRIAPRVVFTSGKTELALEYTFDIATYGTAWDEKLKINDKSDPVMNRRILIEAKYSF